MNDANKKRDLRSYERTRAAGFVLRYETELRTAVRKGSADMHDKAIAIKVADRLKDIRNEIMGAVAPYQKPVVRDTDGFAGEEIEQAMAIMDQLEENPFE